MKFILGKKLEMSQVYGSDGSVIPVTLIQAGPCTVTQVRPVEGEEKKVQVQVGFDAVKRLNKPQAGHLKDLSPMRFLREFTCAEGSDLKRGDIIDAAAFQSGEKINVTGVSKGKGFQGVVKRHHFHGHPSTHGHKDQLRMPGSIGAGGVQHVLKGRRMGGHMGDDQVTVRNLVIIEVREGGVLAVKGAIPGGRHALIEIISL